MHAHVIKDRSNMPDVDCLLGCDRELCCELYDNEELREEGLKCGKKMFHNM